MRSLLLGAMPCLLFAQAPPPYHDILQRTRSRPGQLPTEALPIRRQFLEAEAAPFRRRHAAHLPSAEVQALTIGVNP